MPCFVSFLARSLNFAPCVCDYLEQGSGSRFAFIPVHEFIFRGISDWRLVFDWRMGARL